MNLKQKILFGIVFSIVWAATQASAFYNPSTGRWLSRDPVEEGGSQLIRKYAQPQTSRGADFNVYAVTRNDPISKIDYFGLLCIDPCGEAKALGLAGSDAGGVVCCGGKKYACVWKPGGSSGAPDSKAQNIISQCIQNHEQSHFPTISCPLCVNVPTREPFNPPVDPNREECAAWNITVSCLQKSMGQCNGDVNCTIQVIRELQDAVKTRDDYCNAARRRPPIR